MKIKIDITQKVIDKIIVENKNPDSELFKTQEKQREFIKIGIRGAEGLMMGDTHDSGYYRTYYFKSEVLEVLIQHLKQNREELGKLIDLHEKFILEINNDAVCNSLNFIQMQSENNIDGKDISDLLKMMDRKGLEKFIKEEEKKKEYEFYERRKLEAGIHNHNPKKNKGKENKLKNEDKENKFKNELENNKENGCDIKELKAKWFGEKTKDEESSELEKQ